MLTLNRHLLAGTALAFAVGVSAPSALLAQQSTSPSTGTPPASSTSDPVMNQSQTGVPSTSGSAGSAQNNPATTGTTGTGSSGTMQSGSSTAQSGTMDNQLASEGKKLVGKDLYGADNQKVGEIDDVLMGPDNKANSVLVDIGGFLGIGAKTVAIQVAQLRTEGDRVVAQNLTKDQARNMPEHKESDANRASGRNNATGGAGGSSTTGTGQRQ
jgi:hypothetical protein